MKKTIFTTLLILIGSGILFAQNIMQIRNAEGAVNSNITISLSIQNDEEFISFQCDIVLPDGFNYIPGGVSLSPRSVDHVVNVTNIENNTIRILSYSLNNTAFLLDSGVVARVVIATPANEGNYVIGLENGIIGNALSVNIIDDVNNGEVTLGPIGIMEIDVLDDKINCYPNPFNDIITIQLDKGLTQPIKLQIFNVIGLQLSDHELNIDNPKKNTLRFDKQSLFGSKPSDGTYLFQFIVQDKDQIYSIVKKIQLNK